MVLKICFLFFIRIASGWIVVKNFLLNPLTVPPSLDQTGQISSYIKLYTQYKRWHLIYAYKEHAI